ncbi:major facilitator superfamily domain-containing protein [Mycena galopus ATCC 62051]|nr:major facilitator superfamily domain-containing protein [Mycena galopus ATCC 62051]
MPASDTKLEAQLDPDAPISDQKIENDASQEAEFPDGGLRAWGTVFGCPVISLIISQFGVFEQYYSVNQLKDQPLSTISWIGSLQLCLVMLMGCVSGPMFDAGYLKPMIACAGTLYVFCLFMTSISVASELYQFVLSQGLGVGIAMGFLYSPSMSTISHHFEKHRTVAFGIFGAGSSVGGAVVPIAMRTLLVKVGFQWAVRTPVAFLVLFCVICGFVCCSTRLPPRKSRRVMDFRVCSLLSPLFQDRAYSFLVFGASVVALGLYAPVSYGVTYAVAHGVSQDLAFYSHVSDPPSLSIFNALSLVGRVLLNLVAQRTGPFNILIVTCGLSSVLIIVWAFTQSTAGILVFNAVFGFAGGASILVVPAAIASLSTNQQDIGLRLGMAFFSASFFWLASSPIQGALIKLHGTYWPAAVFSGSVVFCGVVMMVIARMLVVRRTAKQWV